MGSNTSKPTNETAVHIQKNDDGVVINADPRSPTPEITRTPLQGKVGGKHNITKNVDLTKTFENASEEKLIHNNPILSAVIKNHLQSYDPRSPTQDFDRTPIVLTTDLDELAVDKNRLRQKTDCGCTTPRLKETPVDDLDNTSFEQSNFNAEVLPKNLCDGFFDMTLDDTLKETEEPLGSSTASQEAIENNLSYGNTAKPTTLLETNFDYIENNDDNVIDEIEPLDSKTFSFIKPHFEVLENDPRSPSIGIERTPIVVAKNEDTSDTSVEEMSDETLIKALQNANANFRQTLPQKNSNDGLLIYEDETTSTVNESPRKSMPECNSESRTPLSCMKNKTETAHVRSKSANTLLDPNCKNMAQSKRVSHIPRLKSLAVQHHKPLQYSQGTSLGSLKSISKTSAISGDCENTPPHSHRDVWDKDSSVVL